MRMFAGMHINRALPAANQPVEPPVLLIIAHRDFNILFNAHRRIIKPGVCENALKAEVQILHIGQHFAFVERVAHAAREPIRVRFARRACVQ